MTETIVPVMHELLEATAKSVSPEAALVDAAAEAGATAATPSDFARATARIAKAAVGGPCNIPLSPCAPPPPGVTQIPAGTRLTADWLRADGFRRPVVCARAEDCGAALPKAGAVPPFRLAELCAVDDAPVSVLDVASQAAEPTSWSLASFFGSYWADESSREALLAMPAADISSSELGEAISAPQAVRELDWARRFWPATAAPPPGRQLLSACPRGGWLDFTVLQTGEAQWRGVLSGREQAVMAPGTPANLASLRRWQRACEAAGMARQAAPIDAQAAITAWGGVPPSSRAGGSLLGRPWCATEGVSGAVAVSLTPGQVLLVPEGWVLAVYCAEDAVTAHGAFAPGLDTAAALRTRRAASALGSAVGGGGMTALAVRRRRKAGEAWTAGRAFGGWGEEFVGRPCAARSGDREVMAPAAAAVAAAAELDAAASLGREEAATAAGGLPGAATPLDWAALGGMVRCLLARTGGAEACEDAIVAMEPEARAVAAARRAAIAAADDDPAAAAAATSSSSSSSSSSPALARSPGGHSVPGSIAPDQVKALHDAAQSLALLAAPGPAAGGLSRWEVASLAVLLAELAKTASEDAAEDGGEGTTGAAAQHWRAAAGLPPAAEQAAAGEGSGSPAPDAEAAAPGDATAGGSDAAAAVEPKRQRLRLRTAEAGGDAQPAGVAARRGPALLFEESVSDAAAAAAAACGMEGAWALHQTAMKALRGISVTCGGAASSSGGASEGGFARREALGASGVSVLDVVVEEDAGRGAEREAKRSRRRAAAEEEEDAESEFEEEEEEEDDAFVADVVGEEEEDDAFFADLEDEEEEDGEEEEEEDGAFLPERRRKAGIALVVRKSAKSGPTGKGKAPGKAKAKPSSVKLTLGRRQDKHETAAPRAAAARTPAAPPAASSARDRVKAMQARLRANRRR